MYCVVETSSDDKETKILNELSIVRSLQAPSERRKQKEKYSTQYENLNLIQKVVVCELGRIGYQLHFIRGKYSKSIAVLLCGENIATVDRQGIVDINSDIKLRN